MKTKELMEQIKDLRAVSKIDIMNVNPQTRPGVEGQIRSAAQKLPALESQYRQSVIESSVPILVHGKFSKKFAEIAARKFNTVIVDYNSVNDRIVNDVKFRSHRDTVSNQEYLLVLNQINLIAKELGIMSISKPDLNQDLIGLKVEQAVPELLNSYYKDELRSAYAARLASDYALDLGFDGTRLPVVLFNSTGNVSSPFGKPVVTLEINETPNEDEMLEIFNKIKTKLKTKK